MICSGVPQEQGSPVALVTPMLVISHLKSTVVLFSQRPNLSVKGTSCALAQDVPYLER